MHLPCSVVVSLPKEVDFRGRFIHAAYFTGLTGSFPVHIFLFPASLFCRHTAGACT